MPKERKGESYVDQDGGKTISVPQEKTDADMAADKAAEKYNPVLRSKEKSAAEVQAMGGLGAVAAALAAKKKKPVTTGTQAEALEKKQ